jgi:dTDP-4-amino-4,6-dideoxygalactose transaminase
VGPGREVITCPNTWITTLTTVFELGARCRFVDIDPATGLMDPRQVAAAIGPATAAILPIHMYGSMVPMAPLMEIAHAAGVPVIEDACQAIGAAYDGQAAGCWGDAGCFSFHATKLVGSPGDGGMLVTRHPQWLDAFRRDAVVQWDEALRSVQARVPSRLAALHVPFLRVRLKRLQERIAGRAVQWQRYHQGLQGLKTGYLLGHAHGVTPAYRNCILMTSRRQAIADECRRHGIPVEIIYPASEAFVTRLVDQGNVLPHALKLASSNLSLPLGRQMSNRAIDRLIDIIRRHDC